MTTPTADPTSLEQWAADPRATALPEVVQRATAKEARDRVMRGALEGAPLVEVDHRGHVIDPDDNPSDAA